MQPVISQFFTILLSAGLLFSTLQLHEIDEALVSDPIGGNSFVTDHYFCPVCIAVFDFDIDTGNHFACYFHTADEQIQPDRQILPSRTFVFKDGRSPPETT